MYDAIVVGARCGGAPLAMLLARSGHRVALVDRTTFPSDTMSTHFLWPRGAARLQAWGLLDRLAERRCSPIRELTFDVGSVQLRGSGPAVDGVSDMFCPRRTVLDALLVEAAVEAGADLIDGFTVNQVLHEEGRVVGVSGHRGSVSTSTRARVVVGADGLRSTVAQAVGARLYCEQPALTGVYYSYWSGIEPRRASFHAYPGRLILLWPTNDDLTCIYVGWPRAEFRRARLDREREFQAALGLVPGLVDAVGAGRREQRLVGTDVLPNQYRVSAGPGWALVGDAGHHKDPSTGMGMSDAFLAADLLAATLDDGLVGRVPMDDALASYQNQRDALTANGYRLTLHTATLAPLSSGLEAFYRQAADEPSAVRHVLGVLGGAIPMEALRPADVR